MLFVRRLRRVADGSEGISFDVDFDQYEEGFGDLKRSFWIGLRFVHALTSLGPSELLVELEGCQGETVYAHYADFYVSLQSLSKVAC